jgi:hypothetical protein
MHREDLVQRAIFELFYIRIAALVFDGGWWGLGCKFFPSVEPGFRGEEDKGDYQQTKNVVLPTAAFVVPQEPSDHIRLTILQYDRRAYE